MPFLRSIPTKTMSDQQGNLFDAVPAPWELDAEGDRWVARVVFPGAPLGEFDYCVPDEFRDSLRPGARVKVPMGRGNRLRVGYCVELLASNTQRRLKSIHSIVDPHPLIHADILALTHWIAEYYVCDWGTALEAVVPADVRGQAGTRRVAFLEVPPPVAVRLSRLDLPPKQMAVVRHLAAATEAQPIADVQAAVDCGPSPIRQLEKKGLVQRTMRRVYSGQTPVAATSRSAPLPLNRDQQTALDAIHQALDARSFRTILMHGVTGSGKTEVYLQASGSG